MKKKILLSIMLSFSLLFGTVAPAFADVDNSFSESSEVEESGENIEITSSTETLIEEDPEESNESEIIDSTEDLGQDQENGSEENSQDVNSGNQTDTESTDQSLDEDVYDETQPEATIVGSSHTREEAVNWVYSQEGDYLDYDGAYGAQCVDLIKYYYDYFGVAGYAKGNAYTYATNSLPPNWTRIQNTADFVPEPGDIAVWTSAVGSGAGHVAIILSADVHSFVSMDQNWPKGSACCQVTHNYNNFWGVVRPDFEEPNITAELSVERKYYNQGDIVTFSFGGDHGDGTYTISIFKELDKMETVSVESDSYSIQLDEVACYSAVMTFYGENGGSVTSNWVDWQVLPLTAELSADKKVCFVNDSVTLSFTGDNNNTFADQPITLAVWCNDEYVVHQNVDDHSYVVNCDKPGEYKSYMTAYGGGELKDSNWVYWTVYEKKDIGDDFYAYITSANTNKNIINIDAYVRVPEKSDQYDPKQIWHFLRQPDNSYKIFTEYTGTGILAADGGTTDNGATVWLWSDTGVDTQRWYISSSNSNDLLLINKYTGKAMQSAGGATTTGTGYELWDINGSSAQNISINKLESANISYSRPKKPGKSIVSVEGGLFAGSNVKLKWTEAPLVGVFDERVYNVEIYKDGVLLENESQTGVTTCEIPLTLALGNYSVKVTSVNTKYLNWYTESDVFEFSVNKEQPISITEVTVTGITNKTYTGTAQTQNPTLKLGDKTLTNGTDYTLSYANNTNVGTATVTITGKGNYTGTISKTFTISAASITSVTVTGIANKTYNGKAQTQNPTVKLGDKTLTNGTDYTLSYANNTNAGTATIKITGKGNYSGTVSKTFTINQAAPALTFASTSISKTTQDAAFTNALTKTTDGSVTFTSSNTKVATVNSTSGKVTIKGAGTTTITATAAAGTNYKAGSAQYTLNVTKVLKILSISDDVYGKTGTQASFHIEA